MKPLTDLELLRAAPPGHLHAIAEARRLTLPSSATAGGPVLEELARRLFHEPSLREALRGLSSAQWAILRELARSNGQAPNFELRAYLIAAGLVPGGGRAPDAQIRLYELALSRLLALGLVFWGRLDMLGAREYASGAHEGLLVAPPSVLAVLAASDVPVEETPANRWQPRAPRLASAELLQRDLYLYWRAVREQSEGLALLANGLLPKSALRPLNMALSLKTELDDIRSEQEAGRLFFLRLLGQALGLLTASAETLRAVEAATFFAQPLAERVQQSFTAWLEGTFWNELLHLPDITLRPPPPPLEAARPEVLRARQVILKLLSEETSASWISRAALLALARLRYPRLLFSSRGKGRADRAGPENPFGWEFRPRGGWLSPYDGWLRVEGAFIAAVIEGPLHWLGAVDLDYAASGEPLAYHVSPVVSISSSGSSSSVYPSAPALKIYQEMPQRSIDFAPGKGEWPQEMRQDTAGRLVIQPNFELLALPPVREATLLVLDEIAERQSFDQAALYRLTRERWLRALRQGNSAVALIERLEEMAQAALPQNMRYSLLEWERQAQRLRLHRRVAVLEVREAALLDTLLADPALAPMILRRLTPTTALVDRARLSLLYSALIERGHLPQRVHPL